MTDILRFEATFADFAGHHDWSVFLGLARLGRIVLGPTDRLVFHADPNAAYTGGTLEEISTFIREQEEKRG